MQWLPRALIGALNLLAAIALLGIMWLTFVDVIARYVFNSPIGGATVVTEILLVCLIFCGLPLVTLRDEHISIDLLDRWVTMRVASLQRRLTGLLCGTATALLAWGMYGKAAYVSRTGETTASLGIPAAAVIYPMSVLIAVMAVVFFAMAIFPQLSIASGQAR